MRIRIRYVVAGLAGAAAGWEVASTMLAPGQEFVSVLTGLTMGWAQQRRR